MGIQINMDEKEYNLLWTFFYFLFGTTIGLAITITLLLFNLL